MQNPVLDKISYFLGIKERPNVTELKERANQTTQLIENERKAMNKNLDEVTKGTEKLQLVVSMLEIKATHHSRRQGG